MKSPLSQLLLLSVFVGIVLWVGVKWFLGGSDDLSDSMDVRSLGHLRDTDTAVSSPQKSRPDPATREPLPPASFGAPEPMKTVEELAEQVDGITATGEAQTSTVAEEQADDAYGASNEEQVESVALGAEELNVRERARKQRLAELGLIPEKPPEPTVAVDVSLNMPDDCADAALARVPVGIKFRYESAIIRGESLNALESLVSLYRDCEQGEFVVGENPLGRADADDTLKQMRYDEVKYFFIQHSVSIDAVSFPEEK